MKLVGHGGGGVEGDYGASSAGFGGQEREDVGVGHGLVAMERLVGGFFEIEGGERARAADRRCRRLQIRLVPGGSRACETR